jgi:GGDEF domain-containing protein
LAGFLLSFASASTWVTANFLAGEQYSHPLVPFWNGLTRLGFFLVVALLLSSLRRLLERERFLARTDFLTGTLNRRAFFDRAAIEFARAGRYRRPFTLIYTVSRMIRTVDLAATSSPCCSSRPMNRLPGQSHQALLQEARSHGWPVRFSIGALTCREPPDGVEELLHRADTLMYGVKSSGKDSVSYAVFLG